MHPINITQACVLQLLNTQFDIVTLFFFTTVIIPARLFFVTPLPVNFKPEMLVLSLNILNTPLSSRFPVGAVKFSRIVPTPIMWHSELIFIVFVILYVPAEKFI